MLEENIARTAGSIGESVAAGAIFTLPAFLIAGSWTSFDPAHAYWKSTALMIVGGILGVLFVSLVRRVMVEDPTLPFPESVAAAEIHKAGRRGAEAARYLFWSMGFGALIQSLGELKLYAVDKDFLIRIGTIGKSFVRLGRWQRNVLQTGAVSIASAPTVSPAYHGRGIRDRAGAGRAAIFGRRAGVGRAGAADHVFPGTDAAAIHCRGARKRTTRMGGAGGGGLALHRAAASRWAA